MEHTMDALTSTVQNHLTSTQPHVGVNAPPQDPNVFQTNITTNPPASVSATTNPKVALSIRPTIQECVNVAALMKLSNVLLVSFTLQ